MSQQRKQHQAARQDGGTGTTAQPVPPVRRYIVHLPPDTGTDLEQEVHDRVGTWLEEGGPCVILPPGCTVAVTSAGRFAVTAPSGYRLETLRQRVEDWLAGKACCLCLPHGARLTEV